MRKRAIFVKTCRALIDFSLNYHNYFTESDACWSDFFKAAQKCTIGHSNRSELISKLQELWTTKQNPNHVLPALSVRTALELYLRVQKFPAGSEIIMSAINIPSMVQVKYASWIFNYSRARLIRTANARKNRTN